MDAYTAAIELPTCPVDVKAMALYNRALLLGAAGEKDRALADLRAIMDMPTLPHNVKLAARRRVERLHHRQDAADRANEPPAT